MVDLAPFGIADRFEELWCHEAAPGEFVVSCLPFFTYGIAFGDVIAAEPPGFAFKSVLHRSCLLTFRGCFSDPDSAAKRHEEVHAALSRLRHPHEWHGRGYVAALLPNPEAVHEILHALASFVEDGSLIWEIDPKERSEGLTLRSSGFAPRAADL